jgi:rfaE bifunctional protein nucleotidyltransferase chain/domain
VTRVLVVGDVLLDQDLHGTVNRVCPDAPAPVVDVRSRTERPGGAALAARLLARPGTEVTLAAAFADDDAGARLRSLLDPHLDVVPIGRTATTRCLTRVRSAGQSLLRLDDPGGQLDADTAVDTAALARAMQDCDAVLVADYGGGLARFPAVRERLRDACGSRPLVWDPHPRGPVPVRRVRACTPNRAEVERALGGLPAGGALDEAAGRLRELWDVEAVVATDGERGTFTATPGRPALFTPAAAVAGVDVCGAGDRFGGTLAAALGRGEGLDDAVAEAVRDVSGWLAAGGVAADPATPACGAEQRPEDVVAAVRARGGTVVATGGCFDVVHAGHVASLEAARRLGSCLVVLVNSDHSVRRLKGPGRPVHTAADRRRVLESLSPVDAVVVFDEDDPSAALDRLRPDVWAKGGDYDEQSLPEADLVRSWGGRVVLLPYLPGRSTTRILAGRGGEGRGTADRSTDHSLAETSRRAAP